MRGLEKASSRQPPVDPSSTSTLDLWWMLPSASVLARKHEERVQKAFSVDHHGPGDARLSHGAKGIYGELGDTVTHPDPCFFCSDLAAADDLQPRSAST